MQGELLLLLAVHILLTALPGVAAALWVASRGEHRAPVLLAVFLAGSGLTALVAFFAYYQSHTFGTTWSILIPLGSLLASGWLLFEGNVPRRALRDLGTGLGLWMLGCAFLVFLGFMHGGTHDALPLSSLRFSSALPSDNYMPYFWGQWFYAHAHHGTPPEFTGDWMSSDRPPLQMAYWLIQEPFHIYQGETNYEILGVVLQQLWIVGLWALLLALPVGRVTRAVTMLAVLVSGLTLLNGLYVWPKLLPAGMLLAAAALLITPLWGEVRGRLWGAALVAALCGLGMMGHGSSVFGILPLVLIAAFRGFPSWRWVGVAVLTLVVVMAPWSAYQKWGDPPGDRLTKWYLGGDVEPDKEGTVEAIITGYENAKLSTILHKKGQDFVAIAGGKTMVENLKASREELKAHHFAGAIRPVRNVLFFNLLPSLALLLLGPILMAVGWRWRRRRPGDWRAATGVLGAFALGGVLWALIQWGGWTATTVIHQGSYLLPVLGLAGCALALRAVLPRFAIFWVVVNMVLIFVIYVPVLEPIEGTSFTPVSAILAALALAGFLAVALELGPGRARGPGEESARLRTPSPVSTPA